MRLCWAFANLISEHVNMRYQKILMCALAATTTMLFNSGQAKFAFQNMTAFRQFLSSELADTVNKFGPTSNMKNVVKLVKTELRNTGAAGASFFEDNVIQADIEDMVIQMSGVVK